MAATSELQLFNFEYNFERAAESILEAGGYLSTFIQGSSATLPASRIEVTFASGAAINQAIYPLDPAQEVYDFFEGRFTSTNLPYYAVKTIRQVGTQRDLDPRWMEDYTRIEFLVQFGIRSQAWPAS